jgi:hypothetical protein
MKVYFSLLSILSTTIMAIPALHRSTHIERIEKSVDLNAYAESGHEIVKRASPVCSLGLCGTVSVSDCVAELENLANDSDGEGSPVCVTNQIMYLGDNCEVSFTSVKTETTCISPKRLSGLATEVFNACVNNPKVAAGGCIEIEDGAVICLENPDKTC